MAKDENIKNKKIVRNSTIEFLRFASSDASDTVSVRYEDDTIWLTQKLMARLFDVSVPTVNEHLKNIFGSGELRESSTIRKFLIVQKEGSRDVSRNIDHYNLDAIISVGYRVNSIRATEFRQWATNPINSNMPISLAYINKQFNYQGVRPWQ